MQQIGFCRHRPVLRGSGKHRVGIDQVQGPADRCFVMQKRVHAQAVGFAKSGRWTAARNGDENAMGLPPEPPNAGYHCLDARRDRLWFVPISEIVRAEEDQNARRSEMIDREGGETPECILDAVSGHSEVEGPLPSPCRGDHFRRPTCRQRIAYENEISCWR
jgi:hypothetical protein